MDGILLIGLVALNFYFWNGKPTGTPLIEQEKKGGVFCWLAKRM